MSGISTIVVTPPAAAAFVAAVIDIGAGQSDIAQYQKNGNIKIDTGDIWIYA